MSPTPAVESWLRGPIEGICAELQPVAHTLLQALDDIEKATARLSYESLWRSDLGVASIGFHLRHLAGSTDRLLTAARGDQLDASQQDQLGFERNGPAEPLGLLLRRLRQVVESALEQLRQTSAVDLAVARRIGRKQLPTSTGDLLHHAAHHAARHCGQIVTTAKVMAAREALPRTAREG